MARRFCGSSVKSRCRVHSASSGIPACATLRRFDRRLTGRPRHWARKCRPLDLNLQSRGIALCVVCMHNDIIQRMTFGSSLELDAVNDRAGQSPRLRAHQHRQEIGGAYLALKMASRRSARCWAGRLTHKRTSTFEKLLGNRPFRRQGFRLLQNSLHSRILRIGREAILAEDAFDTRACVPSTEPG
jgi:hypothetical protein